MNLPRVVVVAPDSDLEFARAGVDAVVNSGLPVSLISGEVTLARLTEWDWHEVEPGGMLYVATAGAPVDLYDGIAISDGVLSVENLAPLLREGRFAAVFLNTLASDKLGYQLVNECGVIVIATLAGTPSQASYQTAVRFFRHLQESEGDYRAAFQRAKPGHNRAFIYLEPDSMNHQRSAGATGPGGSPDDLAGLRFAVNDINRALLGDEYTPGGLVGQMRRLQESMESIARVDATRRAETEQRWGQLEAALGDHITALSKQVEQMRVELEDMRNRRFVAPERFLMWVLLAGLPLVTGIAVYVVIMAARLGGG